MILDHGNVDFRSEWTDRTYGSPEGDLYSPENNQPVFVLNHKSLQKLIDVYRQREAIVQSTKEPLPYESLVAGMDTGESGAGGVKYGRDIAAATVHKLLAALRVIQDYPDWYFSPDTTPHKIQANQTAYPTDVWDLSTKSLNIATLLWELRYTRLAPLGVRYRVWGVTGCAHYVAGYEAVQAYNDILHVSYPPGPYPAYGFDGENDPAFKAAIREHYNEAKARENTEIPANLYTLRMFGYTNSPNYPYTQASVCYAYHIDSGPPSYETYAQYGTCTLNRAMAVRYVNITDQPQTFMLRLDFKLSGGYGSSPSIESNSTYPYSLAFGEISKADFDATGAGGTSSSIHGSVYPSTPREPFSLAAFRTGADIRSVNRAFSNPEIVTRIIGPFTLAPKKTLHVAAQGIIGGSRNVTISNYYWGPQKYDAYFAAIVELKSRMWNQSNNYFSGVYIYPYWIELWNWATAQIPVAISAANEARAEAVAANQLGIVSVYDGILADLNSPWPQPTSKDQAVAAAVRADNIANITIHIGWDRSNFSEGGAIRYDLPKISLDSGATWLAHANSILPVA